MANPMLRTVSRLLTAANDNDPAIAQRDNRIRRLRGYGMSLRALSRQFDLGVGKIRYICQVRAPLTDTARSVVHEVLVLGAAGSGSCYRQPVSLPRITVLDGPYVGAAAEGVAA